MPPPAPRLKVGDAAPDAVVYDIHGQPFSLASLWPNHLTLINFLRHYG